MVIFRDSLKKKPPSGGFFIRDHTPYQRAKPEYDITDFRDIILNEKMDQLTPNSIPLVKRKAPGLSQRVPLSTFLNGLVSLTAIILIVVAARLIMKRSD